MTRDPEAARKVASLHSQVAVAHRTALILVVAFAMSIIVFAGIGFLILSVRSTVTRADLPYAFYGAAAVLAIGSIVIRRAQLHSMKLEVVATTRGVEGLIKHLVNSTIIAAAIAEAIGMLALAVAFFGGDQNDVVRLGIVALAVSLYNYPRRSAWQRAADYFFATLPGGSESQLGL